MAIKTKWKNSALAGYIHEKSSLKSRFEIDRELLEGGYTPQQVEAAWQLLRPTSIEAVAEAWQVLGNSRQNPWRKPLSMRQHSLYFGFLLIAIILALLPAWVWGHDVLLYFYPINSWVGIPLSFGALVVWFWHDQHLQANGYKRNFWLYNAIIFSLVGFVGWLFLLLPGNVLSVYNSKANLIDTNIKGRDYHLVAVSHCYAPDDGGGCSLDLYLYSCQFANLICPLSADIPYGGGNVVEVTGLPKSISLVSDPSTDKINLLKAGRVIYAFDP